MTRAPYIHGGTDAREVARLEKQARFCAGWMLERFDAARGHRVLDLATGVGAMAGRLLERFPGIELVGVDLSASQLGAARQNHPQARYTRADAARLPFPAGAFDRVHGSWFLEHVPKATAVAVLGETHRVLRPGGWAHFTEVDNSTFRTEPVLPGVLDALAALNRAQERAGGDPFIGPKLSGYAREAGFQRVEAHPSPISADAREPGYFQGFVDEFAEIFESVDEALLAPLHEAARQLRALVFVPGASIHYCATIARCQK